jgi:predicted ATPase
VLLNNLPAQVSSFVGREAELAAVRALVGRSRLVTLTGAGGRARPGWGCRRRPVGGRRLLVLLDNCEHVIRACAKLADALLRGCPNLALLATSREPLGIDGEYVYRVPSLGVPGEGDDAGAVRASEAVRLLADRAAAQGVPLAGDTETAEVAGRICRRLDGIPLAIELAAARLRVMPPAELEARLADQDRQRLRAARAPRPSRPNTPRAAPSTCRSYWLRSRARTPRARRRANPTRPDQARPRRC